MNVGLARVMALEDPIILRTDNACTGTRVYLHRSNWNKHVEKRPELSDHLASVRITVEDPDFVLQNDEGVVFKYRHGLGTGKFARLRLIVIESPDEAGAHYIRTAYFTLDVVGSSVLCVSRLVGGMMEMEQGFDAFRKGIRAQAAETIDRFLKVNGDVVGTLTRQGGSCEYVKEHDHLYIVIGKPREGMALFLGCMVAICDPESLELYSIEVPDFLKGVATGALSAFTEVARMVQAHPIIDIPPVDQAGSSSNVPPLAQAIKEVIFA